jgi:DNA/RNA endonuclease YhcR with UshA esterase domain
MKKTILISATILLFVAAVSVYLLWNKPHKEVKSAEGLPVSAAELYNQYITDSAKANLLYTGKVVDVKGEVVKFSVNQQGRQVILIKTPVDGAYINCTMEEEAPMLKEGSVINIKGICSGYIAGDADMGLPGDVFLIRGYSSTK